VAADASGRHDDLTLRMTGGCYGRPALKRAGATGKTEEDHMDSATRDRIEVIIGGMSCPKNFQCAESGFEVLCKAEDVGLRRHLKCLDDEPNACPFAMPISGTFFCQCPLRVYLAKKLHK